MLFSFLKKIRGAIKISLFLIFTFFLCTLFFIGKYNHWTKKKILQFWHTGSLLILNVKLSLIGTPSIKGKMLFVCNHISYLDIPAIASKIDISFIAKSEVRKMAGFGWLGTLQDTIFIDRAHKLGIRTQMKTIVHRLNNLRPLVLFAEGISTQGLKVHPFKSSLFAIVDHIDDLNLQPISIIYKTRDGKKLSLVERDFYAFYKQDDSFGAHFWTMACQKGVKIELIFHKPITAVQNIPRKELAQRCYEIVSKPFVT